MEISKSFSGGNIQVVKVDGDTVYLENEMRDSAGDWFYWAFCVTGANGRTVKFVLNNQIRVGYYGAAVSRDFKHWEWSNTCIDGASFSYTFGENDGKVYFAHDMLYTRDMLFDFAHENGIEVKTLGKSRKGRDIPYFEFGAGKRHMVLTARHHACEATGSYVLEGLIKELYENPLDDTVVFCVPMVDYDGVCDGDQGKSRVPHDHNRDYAPGELPLYETTAAIRKYVDEHNVTMGFDFHSPWHLGELNDKVYIVRRNPGKNAEYIRFGKLLTACITDKSMQYDTKDDLLPNTGWNQSGTPTFANYILKNPNAEVAFTLETCYFGEKNNVFSQEKGLELGKCFAAALKKRDIFKANDRTVE